MNKLSIKAKGQKQSFEIFDDYIKVELNTSQYNLKYDISFGEIENEKHIQESPKNKILTLVLFSILVNVLFCFYYIAQHYGLSMQTTQILFMSVTIAFVPVFKIITQATTELHIKASKHLYFIQTPKNINQINEFVASIFENQRKYFRRKYFTIDYILPYNLQLERYLWLYQNKHITENEYEIIKEALDEYFILK